MDGIVLLRNPVQEYAWGSQTFIQQLVKDAAARGRPAAELWMGTHPLGPSEVLWEGRWMFLSQLIQESPERILGEGIARKFRNQLPFLFKVLAAAKPLSIQCHPNLKQAEAGFRREESCGLGLRSTERNYKDQNHKPEIFCALRPSWVLKGFRNLSEIRFLIDKLGLSSAMGGISTALGKGLTKSLRAFFTAFIELDHPRQKELTSEAVKSIRKTADREPSFAWVVKLSRLFPDEPMVLSPLLLNLIHLKPGDAVMINPGTLHAYLKGAGVELMANSDNVLRAGLTRKTKNIAELLRVVNFHQEDPITVEAASLDVGERLYPSEAAEFALSLISTTKNTPHVSFKAHSLEIMFCVAGRGRITDLEQGGTLSVARGVSFLVPAFVGQYRIDGRVAVYKASVPLQ